MTTTDLKQKSLLLLVPALLLSGCLGLPQGAVPVTGFELERYLGTWYEIARLDHSFERGLSRVEARYSLREDGGIRVINRGFDARTQRWNEAEGRAYFIDDPHTGRLKVSFFGPFFGAYNIIELDHENYQYALVVGNDTDYMWILARDPRLGEEVVQHLVQRAATLGFDTDQLIFPEHKMDEEQ